MYREYEQQYAVHADFDLFMSVPCMSKMICLTGKMYNVFHGKGIPSILKISIYNHSAFMSVHI